MPTVLYVLHNHPAVMPGGAETYAVELFNAMKASPDYKPVLVARTGPPVSRGGRAHEGTLLESAGAPDEYFFHTDVEEYDWFLSSSRNKASYTRYFRDLLTAYRPDVVHFQHTLFIGYDVLRETRRTLPDSKIVYTLHEYLPICHNSGQMMTTYGELCHKATPRRCNECYPDISPQQFFLRERFIKSHLGVVDMFVSPSQFLIDRYVDWGIPRDRIMLEPNGRTPIVRAAEPAASRPRRDRIGYFGQFTAFKGADVLLRAMQILAERREADPDLPSLPTVRLHGANIEHQRPEFQQLFSDLISNAGRNVTMVGRYRPADLPELMAALDWVVVPSIWWENSPLVIQEAFAHGRPVICSDIGGMAEKVTDQVDGLHFRAGDPSNLADTLMTAITTPGMWDRLSSGIREVHSIDAHVQNLSALYDRLLARSPAVQESMRQPVLIGDGRVD